MASIGLLTLVGLPEPRLSDLEALFAKAKQADWSAATLQALTPEALSYATVSDEDQGCDVGIAATGHETLAVVIRERPAPDDREWSSMLNRFHPDRREPLEIEADAAVLLVNDDVFVIAIRRGTLARFVQLRTDVFDHTDALALAASLSR